MECVELFHLELETERKRDWRNLTRIVMMRCEAMRRWIWSWYNDGGYKTNDNVGARLCRRCDQ